MVLWYLINVYFVNNLTHVFDLRKLMLVFSSPSANKSCAVSVWVSSQCR